MGFLDKLKSNPTVQKGLEKARDKETQEKLKGAAKKQMGKRQARSSHGHHSTPRHGHGAPLYVGDDYDDEHDETEYGSEEHEDEIEEATGMDVEYDEDSGEYVAEGESADYSEDYGDGGEDEEE